MRRFTPSFSPVFSVAFVACLCLPAGLFFAGIGSSIGYIRDVEKRNPAGFPPWRDFGRGQSWFDQLNRAVVDSFPFRGVIIAAKQDFDLHYGGRATFGDVTLGREDWLFLHQESGAAIGVDGNANTLTTRLEELIRLCAAHGTRFVFLAAPPKQEIYPEFLGYVDATAMRQFAKDRESFHDALARFPPDQVVDLRARLLAAKAASPELLYLPRDTHHSYHGSMFMAQAIVDALSPGLWNPADIVSYAGRSERGDLHALAGFSGKGRTWPIMMEYVSRPGVHATEERPAPPSGTADFFVRYHTTSENPLRRLIPGKTVVICDSYVTGFICPSLAQYFSDVTFVSNTDVDADRMAQIASHANTVILECVQRGASALLRRTAPKP